MNKLLNMSFLSALPFYRFFLPWPSFLLLVSVSLFSVLLNVEKATAREFHCEVMIDDRQISDSSYHYLADLETELTRYINENQWTDDSFDPGERIRCRIQIIFRSVDNQSRFTAEVIFNLLRPIYDTMQETSTVILADDNWVFSYAQNRNLIFDQRQFDALTGFIDFYMYVLLGYDYDSFSPLGGTPYFGRAMEIMELGQMDNAAGWSRAIGSQRNRFGLINDLMNPSSEELRRAYYIYHRLGLDQFINDSEEARYQIIDAISRIRNSRQFAARSYLYDIFFDAKYQELTSLLIDADSQTRQQAYNLLQEADPSHSGAYSRLE